MHHIIAVAAVPLFAVTVVAHAACDFTVEVGDTLQYSVNEMVAESSCETINVTITHTGSLPKVAMGHNWVLSKTEDKNAIASDGMTAGIDNDYVKPGDPRVLAHTKIVGGGESDSVSFSPSDLTPGSDYTFFCSFPGHAGIMSGKFVLE